MRKWLSLGILLLLLLIFFPQIASTPLGKPFFARKIEEKSGADVEVGSLKFSWFGPQIFRDVKFQRNSMTGSFEELHILAPFWSFSGPFQLKNGQIAYQEGKIENIEGKIEDHNFSLTGVTFQGHLALTGQIYSNLHFYIQIDVEKFPLVVLDQRLDQLLGPTIDLFGYISMDQGKGLVDLTVESAHLKTQLKGILTPNGIALAEPLYASIHLTPEVSSLLLKKANPLFITGLSAENPVTLQIETAGFFFPIPYSLESLKVGKATLDLGKIQAQNGPTLATIISLLKANLLSNASQMNIWFTPVTFQMDAGILKAGRLDALLADSIHICTWGNIDLLKDRLDMILGVPADTLKRAFGIKNLPENYVLKLDIKGTTQSPDINQGAAAAKIAALLATGQIPKKGIFGGIAEFFSRKEDADIPLPKRPFPWEERP